MKKLLTMFLVALLILSVACTKPEEKPVDASTTEAFRPEEAFKTLGDVLDYESPTSCCYEDLFIYVFEREGVFYRVESDVTPEIFEEYCAIDYFDEQKDQKTKSLLGELPVKRIDDLSAAMPGQAELDKLVGKTGQELLDMGYAPTGSYGFGEDISMAFLAMGPFEFQFDFAENVPSQDDYDVEETIKPLTVKHVEFATFSDYCTDRDFEP